MRLIALSDLHGFLPPRLPDCDLLLIAGDLGPLGAGPEEARRFFDGDFRRWLDEQPAGAIAGVAGNHDFVARDEPGLLRSLEWLYLEDEPAVAAGVAIWGSPWALPCGDWAWTAREEELEPVYARIPADVEIVLSHGPAHGCGDLTSGSVRAGSLALRRRLDELPRLGLVVSGHIHEARGTGRTELGWQWANAAQVTVRYEPSHEPLVLAREADGYRVGTR
jgi:hypothetical protein